MKISASQKVENRQAILDAAVDVIIEKGFRAASMRAVARKAGVGDATIYNYFPTKETLLYGYYQDALETAAEALVRVEGIESFDSREKLQVFFDSILDGFLKDREFVAQTFASVFFHPIPVDKSIKAIRTRFVAVVENIFEQAVETGELPGVMFEELVHLCIWDFYIATVLYWLKDDSERFTNTTVFIDKSLDLGYAVLKSGVLSKVMGLASFLFKSHVLSRMDLFTEQRDALQRITREFMDHGER